MYDLILAGGGLANGLLAYRLRQVRPELRVLLIEQAPRLGGSHTWSFFASDLSVTQLQWMAPFVEHRWPHYDVVFPDFERRLQTPYLSFGAERFHQVLSASLGDALRLGVAVKALEPEAVALADGSRLNARAVVDGRGYRLPNGLVLGYQKFTGHEVELEREHGLPGPMLMDARVPQLDGFRFFYTLPLGPRRLLIEDTRYSDEAVLDPERDAHAIDDYAERAGWQISTVRRRETGVLPVALGGDIDAFCAAAGNVALSGLRAGLFHATTGYTLPLAVALADRLAALGGISAEPLRHAVTVFLRAHWRRQRFYRLLNRMMFRAATPEQRYLVFQRFYRLPQGLIERFYADRLTRLDRVRILSGRPPVPLGRALAVMRESALSGG